MGGTSATLSDDIGQSECLACERRHRPHTCDSLRPPKQESSTVNLQEEAGASDGDTNANANANANAEPPPTDDVEHLERLKSELQIVESVEHIGAAMAALRDPTCMDPRPHAYERNRRPTPALWPALIKIMRKLALRKPPSGAVDLLKPADATLIGNLQLLLRVTTMSGTSASRGETDASAIAVAVEMLRDTQLHTLGAFARHNFKLSTPSAVPRQVERVGAVKRQLVASKLLAEADGSILRPDLLASPIDRESMGTVRERIAVSVAEAAAALATNGGSIDAACAYLEASRRPANASGSAAAEESAGPSASSAEDALSDPILLPLSLRLAIGSSAPSLVSTAAALALCQDETLSLDAAVARFFDIGHGDKSQRKLIRERLTALVERLRALGPLDFLLRSLGEEGASSSQRLPLSDDAWILAVRDRLGPVRSFVKTAEGQGAAAGEKDKILVQLAEPPYLRAALELTLGGHQDVRQLCEKHGVNLATATIQKVDIVRSMRNRL